MIFQHLLEHIERTGAFVKNLALKAQLEGLREIGLDRVNNAVAATIEYIVDLEEAVPTNQQVADSTGLIADLAEQNALLRAELAAVYKAVQTPTPDTVSGPTPGFAGDPPGGSPGAE